MINSTLIFVHGLMILQNGKKNFYYKKNKFLTTITFLRL